MKNDNQFIFFFLFGQNPKTFEEIKTLLLAKEYEKLAVRLEKRMEFGTAGIESFSTVTLK